MSDEQKKPLNHPDYEMPGLPGVYNFTQWSRENIPKPPPSLKVGDRVFCYFDQVETRIAGVHEDCDGTPLYRTEDCGNGHSEGCFVDQGQSQK